MSTQQDELFMQRAMELAELGRGHVSPNPLVGCVIENKGKIIGEGYHEKYGSPHAEVNAVNSVKNKEDLVGATVYVNLEPCSHYGKTPPCADMLVKLPLARVVFSNLDPNPVVAGKGFEKLMSAGFRVDQGLLEERGRELNRRFFTFMEKKRPYIILKWAETADGYIARENYDSKWISNELSRRMVHKWRSEEDAVLVGTNTALYDNPQLNVRDWTGRDPVRLVIDKQLQIAQGFHLLDGKQPTIVYNEVKGNVEEKLVEYVKVDHHENMVNAILQDLYDRRIQSVMVEGGTKLLTAFIEMNLWDEARVFRSPVTFGNGIAAPFLRGHLVHRDSFKEDELMVYRRVE